MDAGLIALQAVARSACAVTNWPTTVIAPVRSTVTQIFFESFSISAARRVAFTGAVFAGSLLITRFAGAVLVSGGVLALGADTVNSMTCSVSASLARSALAIVRS